MLYCWNVDEKVDGDFTATSFQTQQLRTCTIFFCIVHTAQITLDISEISAHIKERAFSQTPDARALYNFSHLRLGKRNRNLCLHTIRFAPSPNVTYLRDSQTYPS